MRTLFILLTICSIIVVGSCAYVKIEGEPTSYNLTKSAMVEWCYEILPYADLVKISECNEFPCVLKEIAVTGRFDASFINKKMIDGWGRRMRFLIKDRAVFEITSAGPNGMFDDEDDLRLKVNHDKSRWINTWLSK